LEGRAASQRGSASRRKGRRVNAEAGAIALIGGAEVAVVRTGRPGRLEAARRGAAVAVGHVPVVALLARLEDAVAAVRHHPGAAAKGPQLDHGVMLERQVTELPVVGCNLTVSGRTPGAIGRL